MIRRYLENERGIALIMVLVIAAISISMTTALIFMVTTGTQVSGMHKRYTTALEAAGAGESVVYEVISTRGNPNGAFSAVNLTFSDKDGCMVVKLLNATVADPDSPFPSGWGNCDSLLTMDIYNSATYDFTVEIGGYRAYAKIVNTIAGNSGSDEGLVKSGVVAANPGEVPVQSRPFLYAIEVDARNLANTDEKARLAILYQY